MSPADGSAHGRTNLTQRLVRGSIWTSFGAIVTAVATSASTLALARLLGVGEFGRMALATLTAALLLGVSDFGVTEALLRRGALQFGAGAIEPGLERRAVSWFALRCPLMVGGFWLVLMPEPAAIALYTASCFVQASFQGVAVGLVIRTDFATLARNRLSQNMAGAAAGVAAAAFGASGVLTCAFSLLVQNCMGLPLLRVTETKASWRGLFHPSVPRLSRQDLTFGGGMFVAGQFNSLTTSRSEVFFFRHSQATERGTYTAQQTIAARITIMIDALFGPVGTALMAARGDSEVRFDRAVQRVLTGSALLLAIVSAPIVCAGALLLLPFFGRGFQGHPNAVILLLVVSLLGTSSQPLISIWSALGRPGALLRATAIAFAFNLLASVLLVARYGVWGAAFSNALGGLILWLLLAVPLLRRKAIRTAVLRLEAAVMASASIGALVALGLRTFGDPSPIRSLAASSGCFLVGVAVAVVLVPLSADEVSWLERGPLRRFPSAARRLFRVAH